MNRTEKLRSIITSSANLPISQYEIKYATKLFKDGKYNSRINLNVPPYQLSQGIDLGPLVESMQKTCRLLHEASCRTHRPLYENLHLALTDQLGQISRAHRCKQHVSEIVRFLANSTQVHVQRASSRYTPLVAVYFNWEDVEEVIGLIEEAFIQLLKTRHSDETMSIDSVIIPASGEHEASLANFTSISESVEYRRSNFYGCYNVRLNAKHVPTYYPLGDLLDSIVQELPGSKIRVTNDYEGIYHLRVEEDQIDRLKTILAMDSLERGIHYTVTKVIIA